MKRNQNGFSIIEIIMVVVIIGLVGAVGWLFWDKIANKPSVSTAATSSTQSVSPSPSPTVSTKTYTSTGLGVAFDYPSTWTVTPNTSHSNDSQAPGSDYQLVTAPSGFTMHFDTIATDGLGGTGPCTNVIKDPAYEGDAGISDAHVISYNTNGTFVLQLSSTKDASSFASNCLGMGYASIIHVKDSTINSDYTAFTAPYEVTFGSTVFADNTISTTKPSNQEYKQAVEILKSLRKT